MADDILVDHRAIAHAVEIMALEAVLAPGAQLASASGPQVLEVLTVGAVICEAAGQAIGQGVATARQRQCSWAEIGRSLGMSRQAAYQRFGRGAPKPGPVT